MNALDRIRFDVVQFSLNLQLFELNGSDCETFLHSQSTQNIKSMATLEWKWSSFLEANGKIESYFIVLKEEKKIKLISPIFFKSKIIERFNKFVVSEDVELIDKDLITCQFFLGPKAFTSFGFTGYGLEERCIIHLKTNNMPAISNLENAEIKLWWKISGLPLLDLTTFKNNIINNTRLFELALDMKKGCFPGQETVSKIDNNRGASYYPVLLESEKKIDLILPFDILINDKKVGTIESQMELHGKFLFEAQLLRDFRIKDYQLSFNNLKFIVKYLPYFDPSPKFKAFELFLTSTKKYQENKNQEALDLLDLAMEFDPSFSDLYEAKGVILSHIERYDEAVQMMKTLLEKDPHSVLAHTNLSLILMKQGKIKEAEDHKTLATVASFSQFGKEAHAKKTQLDLENQKKEELKKREEMFKQVLEIDPDDTMALFGMAEIFHFNHKLIEARVMLEKILAVDAQYSKAYLLLAKIYSELNQPNEKDRILEKGIKIAAQKGDLKLANEMQLQLRN